jgi:hypothetical protein
MTIQDLYASIEGHEALEGVSVCVDEKDPHVVIRHKTSNLLTKVHVNALADVTWQQLEKVLCGEVEPRVLEHMTRVVGYYSRTSNWNRSKLGELRDRIRGQYGLEGDRNDEARATALSVVDSLAG